jgi:hypothetical protein
MSNDDIIDKIRKKYDRLSGVLDERSRRIWASAEAEANCGQSDIPVCAEFCVFHD